VTDAARVLLTAAALAGTAIGAYALRLAHTDADSHERLVGQLRMAHVLSVVLAAMGASDIGLAIASGALPSTGLDVAVGAAFIAAGAFALSRAPREALFLLACAFLVHALSAIAHRPGMLTPALAPPWYTVGAAVFDVYLSAVCHWARRR
jgi:hypothetical protein